jgi:hypothetical protein
MKEVVEGSAVVLLASGFGDPFTVNCGPRLSCAEARRPDVLVPAAAVLPPLGEKVVLPCWPNVVSGVIVGGCAGDCVGCCATDSVGAGPSAEVGEVVPADCVKISVGAGSAEVAGAGGFACTVSGWLTAGPGGGAFVEDAGGESVEESVGGVLVSVATWTSVSLVEEAAVVAGILGEGVFGGVAMSVVSVVGNVTESRPVVSGDTPVEDGTGLESV